MKMKFIFYVFSGSGNTDKACCELRKKLERGGAECEYRRFRKGERFPLPQEGDAVVLGYPVHAFNAPEPVTEFVKKLPDGNKNRAYLITTSGEPLTLNDCAFRKVGKILGNSGYDVRGEYRFVMPYNIIFRHSDGMASRLWKVAVTGIARAAEEILTGMTRMTEIGLGKKAVSAVFGIEHLAMPFIGRGFRVTDECVGCGKCEKICPQANITIKDGKAEFGKNCVGCMGCAFSCPKDAVRTGILNGWRVNGKYDFDAPPVEDDKICKYLGKTYLSYFQRGESVLK